MKNLEKLIGKKVRGFKFEFSSDCSYNKEMDTFIGKIGVIHSKNSLFNCYNVLFNNGKTEWSYPADQIEAHLVEDEIPTLSDGVMMLVSNNGTDYLPKEVLFKKNNRHYAFCSLKGILVVGYKYAKPIEPTKEEQLAAILGSNEKVSEIMELFKN